jgi:hypothetical protein
MTRGGTPASGFGMEITTPHNEKVPVTKQFTELILNLHAQIEDKIDNVKDSFYEE